MDYIALNQAINGSGGGSGLAGLAASLHRTNTLRDQHEKELGLRRDQMIMDNGFRTNLLDKNHEIATEQNRIERLRAQAQASNLDAGTQTKLFELDRSNFQHRKGIASELSLASTSLLSKHTKSDGTVDSVALANDPKAQGMMEAMAAFFGPEFLADRPTAKEGAVATAAINPNAGTVTFGFQNPGESPVPISPGAGIWEKGQPAMTGDLASQMQFYQGMLTQFEALNPLEDYAAAAKGKDAILQQVAMNGQQLMGTPPAQPGSAALIPGPSSVEGVASNPPGSAPRNQTTLAQGAHAVHRITGDPNKGLEYLYDGPVTSSQQADFLTDQKIKLADNTTDNQLAILSGQTDEKIRYKHEGMTDGEKTADELAATQNQFAIRQVQTLHKDWTRDKSQKNLMRAGMDEWTKVLSQDQGIWDSISDVLVGGDVPWENADHMMAEMNLIMRDPDQRQKVLNALAKAGTPVSADDRGIPATSDDAARIVKYITQIKTENRKDNSAGILTWPKTLFRALTGAGLALGETE